MKGLSFFLLSVSLVISILYQGGSAHARSVEDVTGEALAIKQIADFFKNNDGNPSRAGRLTSEYSKTDSRTGRGAIYFGPVTGGDNAEYDPETDTIAINPTSRGMIETKHEKNRKFAIIQVAQTLVHEWVHKDQPKSMHKLSRLSSKSAELKHERDKETPAYDAALAVTSLWAESIRKKMEAETDPAKKLELMKEYLIFTEAYVDYVTNVELRVHNGTLYDIPFHGLDGKKDAVTKLKVGSKAIRDKIKGDIAALQKTISGKTAVVPVAAPPAAAPPAKPIQDLKKLNAPDTARLFGEICQCTCNPTVGGGFKYDPQKGCFCLLNLGDAYLVPMQSSGACFDSAAATAGVDPKELAGKINKDNDAISKEYIDKARRIMQEYLKMFPGLSRKKTGQDGTDMNSDYIVLAANIADDASLRQFLYAASSAGEAPSSYLEMVREKNRRGDPDRALSLVKTAETFMPDRKASGETANILAEFAIMMSKASLNIVTDLEFDEGLYLLRKAAGFNKSGESNALGQDINRLIGNFEKWKNDWNLLQQEIPKCLSLITKKQVCGCDKLFQDKIHPAASSLTIYESASSDKWKIGTATGTPRPIPKKDKLFDEMKSRLALAKNQCELNPALSAKEMKDLMDYDTRKKLEHSQYINQADLKKNSAPVICDTRAVKYAEKMLSAPGLCDCQQDKIKGILDMAKKGAEPLIAEFTSDRKELTLGERVVLSLKIKGGKPPFSAEMSGHYTYKKNYDDSRGFIINYQPAAAGNNVFYVTAADSCGESESKKLSVYVKPGTSSKTPYDPMKDPNLQSVKKPVDTAQIDKFGADFHDTQKWNQPKAAQDNQQQAAPQSEAYTGSKKKQEDGKKEKGNHQKPPYPPNNSYDDRGQKAGTDWTKWATQGAAKSTGQTDSTSVSSSAGSTGASSSGSTDGAGSTSQGTTQPVPKPAGSPPKLGIYLTLENKSQSPVHIFIDGFGEKMNPDNRIDPGGSRTLHSTLNAFEVVFVAGRNGQALTSTKWIPPAGTSNADLKVVFTLNEKLEVQQTR